MQTIDSQPLITEIWHIGNGQICISYGKDLVVAPDFYGTNTNIAKLRREGK